MTRANEEDVVQQVVAQYLNTCGALWHHPANGGLRNIVTATRLRRCGVSKGAPDVIIYTPPPRIPAAIGAAMELKRGKGGRLSAEQRDWLKGLGELGWATAVCHGVDEALAMLKDWGYEP